MKGLKQRLKGLRPVWDSLPWISIFFTILFVFAASSTGDWLLVTGAALWAAISGIEFEREYRDRKQGDDE